MRLGSPAFWTAIALAGCGYDFRGDGDTSASGGRGGGTATATSGSPSTTVTATTDSASASTGAPPDTTTAIATSSSTGIVEPMGRCRDSLGDLFVDDFSQDDDPNWSAVPDPGNGMGFVGRVQGGKAHLQLASLSKLWLRSARFVDFVDCSVEAELVKPSAKYDGMRLAFDAGTFLGVYRADDGWVPYSQVAYVGVAPSVMKIPPGQWIRFRAEGATVFIESSADGTTYTDGASYLRTSLPFLDLNVALTFTLETKAGADDVAEWDNLNTNP